MIFPSQWKVTSGFLLPSFLPKKHVILIAVISQEGYANGLLSPNHANN